MDLGLAGRTCVVTGASRGIGFETARLLLAEGARVLLVARGEEQLLRARDTLGADDALATLACDVTAPDAAERIDAACAALGPCDVLVNNAGTSRTVPLEELSDDDWRGQYELHVMGPMRLMRALAPGMAQRGWGRIVNVTSSSGKRPSSNNVAYSVTKAAQLSLSRAFADAYAGRGVLVNAVAPGPAATELWIGEEGLAAQISRRTGEPAADVIASREAGVPVGRFARPEEIAAAIVFLCSGQASYVAGAAWSVDGGTVPIII
jgi:3-oxoacyl-[acyl-carrier protein] reductase